MQPFVRYSSRLLLAIALCSVQMPALAEAPAEPTDQQLQTEAARAAGRIALGGRFGDSASEGYLDFLQPLVIAPNGLLFLNPKVSATDDDEEEWSIGLGARTLLPTRDVILGANLFYDARSTRHDHTFDQIGAGVEALSKWVDARANYYWPDDKIEKVDSTSETSVQSSSRSWWGDVYARDYQLRQNRYNRVTTTTTTRYFDRFEAALEGYDMEVGVRLPYLPDWLEARVFGGYYSFDGDFTDEISGFKGRLEVRALPALVLDAEVYEDDRLTGSDYMIGARLELPFDLGNLARGKNPFEGASGALRPSRREMRDRLSDMVIRDPHVRMHESGWIEDEAAQQVSTRSKTTKSSVVVLDDVNFVNNANASGIENGSAKYPWNTVQEGVNAATGQKNVYVFQGVANYRENVAINHDGVNLLGEGKAIPGYGGKTFGGGKFPKLDGNVAGVNGPVIRVTGNNALIQGFEITRSPGGMDPGNVDALGLGFSIDRIGVLAENADNLTVFCNKINQQNYGIVSLYDAGLGGAPAELMFTATENTIEDIAIDGINMLATGPGSYRAALSENTLRNIANAGVYTVLSGISDVDLWIADNNLSGVPQGLSLQLFATNSVTASVLDNRIDALSAIQLFTGPIAGDLDLDLSGNNVFSGSFSVFLSPVGGDAFINISENAQNGGPGGIALFGAPIAGDLELSMDGNSILNSGGGGLSVFLAPVGGDLTASFSDNEILNAAGGGLSIFSPAANGDVFLEVSRNRVIGSGGGGISILGASAGGDFELDAGGNVVNNNAGSGLTLTANTIVGDAAVRITDSSYNGNGGAGLFLSLPDVGGDLSIVIDPTTANANGGGGIFVTATAQSNAVIMLDQVTANNNGNNGVLLTLQSITGSVVVLMRDVVAHTNAGNGVYAIATAYEYIAFGDPTPTAPVGNRIFASGNSGSGVQIFGNSATGSILSVNEILSANGNVSAGVVINLQAEDLNYFFAREIQAIGNQAFGATVNADSASDVAIIDISRGVFNQNLGFGAQLFADAATTSAILLGNPFPIFAFDTSLIPGSPGPVVANNNQGPGMIITGNSLDYALTLANVVEVRSNNGPGLILSLTGAERAAGVLGAALNLAGPSFDPGLLHADFNNGAGVFANIIGANDTAGFAILNGTANNNAGPGVFASVLGDDAATASFGAIVLDSLPITGGTFRADSNDGPGISATINSVNETARFVFLDGGASGNNGPGVIANVIGADGDAFFGGFLPGQMPGSLSFNDNQASGLSLIGSTTAYEFNLGMGAVEASRNNGDGISLILSAASDIISYIGLAPGVSNLLTRPVVANDNTGTGVNLLLNTTGQISAVYLFDTLADSNGGDGIKISATSGSSATFVLGMAGSLPSLTGQTGLSANSNAAAGISIQIDSGDNLAVYGGEMAANRNDRGIVLNADAFKDATVILGVDGLTTSTAPIVANANTTGDGLRADVASQTGNVTFALGQLEANRNGANGGVVTLSAQSNVVFDIGQFDFLGTLLPGSISASSNAQMGFTLSAASAAGHITGRVANVTAVQNNLWNLSIAANAGAGVSDVDVRDSVANDSAVRSGMALSSIGGISALLNLTNLTANGNAERGITAVARGGSTNSSVLLLADGLTLNNNARTGGVFRADTGGSVTSIVRNFTADSNVGHGVLVLADTALNASVTVQGSASSNTRYGVVGLAVGTNSAIVSPANIGTGNGSGNLYSDVALTGTADDLLP